jgi:hypothetical protein
MKSDYPVVLAACVILPMPLADTLLRTAETPRLYMPRWGDDILREVSKNLALKFNKTEDQVKEQAGLAWLAWKILCFELWWL